MTQDEIIELAKEAGFILDKFETEAYAPNVSIPNRKRDDVLPSLIKFAKLILSSQTQPTNQDIGWNFDDIDETNCNSDTLEQFCRDNIRLAPFFAMLANKIAEQRIESIARINAVM